MFFNPALKRMSIFTGAALLAGVAAFAQPPGGGGSMMQQPGGNATQQQPGNAPSAMNNNSNNSNQSYNSNQQMEDKEFVEEALEGGMAEVQLGQLALQKGSTTELKVFGERMADEHGKLNDAMLQVARQAGVKPPKGLSKKDKQLLEKLQGLSGPQFDDAYIMAVMKDHKKDQQAFAQEAGQAQIPAIRQIAQQGQALIASHQQMIEQLAQAHNLEHGKS